MSGSIPESRDGVTLLTLLVVLAAGYDAGNEPKIAKLLDLIGQVREALDGERQPSHERCAMQ